MHQTRTIIISALYFLALLAYGRVMNPITFAGDYQSAAAIHASVHSSASFASASSQNQDKFMKIKRRKRRVIHFDVANDDTVTAFNFTPVFMPEIFRQIRYWTNLSPPTPPPA